MSFIDNSANKDAPQSDFSEETPLKVRTHNIGFVLETMSITGDLRPVKERANEIADNILQDDPNFQPDIICFQETFHSDGTKILCDRIKGQYPYIISGVLPTASGFNSGTMIASKYPILEAEFHCLKHNIFPESLSSKGMIRITVQTAKGPMNIYSTHTQALIGKDRAEARLKQLEQIRLIMQKDYRQNQYPQLLVGDLNTSRVTAWGENNMSHSNNPEKSVMEKLENSFDDIYLKDHDENSGQSRAMRPLFLNADNRRMNLSSNLPEPTGSWYVGPFAKPNTFLSKGVFRHITQDHQKHNYTVDSIAEKKVGQNVAWGTSQWRGQQQANTARFDYMLFPKGQDMLDGRAEIRRVVTSLDKQSSPTDHLPVDAWIWRKDRR